MMDGASVDGPSDEHLSVRESQLTVRPDSEYMRPSPAVTRQRKKWLHAYSLLNSPANFAFFFSLQIVPGFASGKPPGAKVDRG